MVKSYSTTGAIMAFSMLLALSGCTSMGTITEQQLSDAQLLQNVLIRDAIVRQVSQECMRIQPSTMPLAYETQAQWWQNNGDWVILADQSINKLVLDSVERVQAPEETTLGLSVTLQVSLLAQQQRDQLITENTSAEACKTLLNSYRNGEHDLSQDSLLAEQLPRLKLLAEEYYPPQPADAEALLQSHDRSQFIAERMAQKSLCEQVRITPLVRQWPREVYNADCGAGRQYLLSCQWGECRVAF